MCIYVYVHVYIYTYMYTHTHIYKVSNVSNYVNGSVSPRVYAYVCVYIIHTYIYYIYIYIHWSPLRIMSYSHILIDHLLFGNIHRTIT